MAQEQQKTTQTWKKIMQMLDPMGTTDVAQFVSELLGKQMASKRLQRDKDRLENYALYDVIGRGAFGQVRLARNLITSTPISDIDDVVAIKRVQKKYVIEKKQIYNIYLERDLMAKTQCDFVVQIKSTFQDQNYLYFAMEYVQGGDLLHLLIDKDTFTEEQTKFYIAEMILAVEEIHKMSYIHRDIKPDNILIDRSGHIKVSDFGLSKYLENDSNKERGEGGKCKGRKFGKMEKLKKLTQIKNKQVKTLIMQKSFSKVGTPDYISPQVLIEKTYDHSVDLWGIGVIMYECLFGYPPFTDESSKEVCHKVANWIEYLEFPADVEVSTVAKMLILGLVNDSNRRLTINQVKNHPFFYGFDWQAVHSLTPPFIPKCRDELDVTNFDQFELKTPWIENQSTMYLKFGKKEKRQSLSQYHENEKQLSCEQGSSPLQRGTTGSKFNFAGFEYRKISKDPLEEAVNELERKSCENKSLKKLPSKTRVGSIKYLKTEQQQQHYSGKKKLMKPKKSIGKQSQFLHNSTTNNTSSSFNLSRMPYTKQSILKTLTREQPIQKQNLTCGRIYNHGYVEQESSPRLKKKVMKGRVELNREGCGVEVQKMKLKKLVNIQ